MVAVEVEHHRIAEHFDQKSYYRFDVAVGGGGEGAFEAAAAYSASKADSGYSATFTLSIHEAILAARNFAVL